MNIECIEKTEKKLDNFYENSIYFKNRYFLLQMQKYQCQIEFAEHESGKGCCFRILAYSLFAIASLLRVAVEATTIVGQDDLGRVSCSPN